MRTMTLKCEGCERTTRHNLYVDNFGTDALCTVCGVSGQTVTVLTSVETVAA